MRQLICATGLTGLVGSRIREVTSHRFDWVNFSRSDGVDITDKAAIERSILNTPSNVLLHLAAFVDADEAWKQTGDKTAECYKVNVRGTANVAKYCKASGKYLIHVSTGYVFDGNKQGAYVETDEPNPLDWYGKTKHWAEHEVQSSGVAHSILRLSHTFRSHFDRKHDVVRKIMGGLRRGALPPMFDDGPITPTLIDDIAEALRVIVKYKPQGIYHIVGSTALTPYQLAQKVAACFGFSLAQIRRGSVVEYVKDSKVRPYAFNQNLSNLKAKERLGISMKSIDESLEVMKSQLEREV